MFYDYNLESTIVLQKFVVGKHTKIEFISRFQLHLLSKTAFFILHYALTHSVPLALNYGRLQSF